MGAVLLLILGEGIVAAHVAVYEPLSVYDEGAHLDYLDKVMRGELLESGERLDRRSMEATACRTIDLEGLVPPACDGSYEPSEFPGQGYNYLYTHPPVYYFLTSFPLRLFRALGVTDFTDAARLANGLWFGLGLAMLWLALLLAAVSLRVAIPVVLIVATTPVLIHISATFNNDATQLFSGAALLAAVLAWERNPRLLWLIPLVGAGVPLLKGTNLVGVIAVAAYLVIRGVTQRSRSDDTPDRRAHLAAVALLLGAAMIASFAWSLFQPDPGRDFVDPVTALEQVDSLSIADVVRQIPAFLTPTSTPNAEPFVGEMDRAVSLFIALVIFGAAAAPPLLVQLRDRLGALGSATIIGMVGGAVALTIANFLVRSLHTLLPPRYGLSIVPLLGVCLALASRSRIAPYAVGGLAGLSAIVTIASLITA